MIRIIDDNVDTQVHTMLLKVHIEAGDLRICYTGLHSCSYSISFLTSTCQFNEVGKKVRTLASDGAVEGVSIHVHRLASALPVSLQNVDSFDRVLDVTTGVDCFHCKHCVDCEWSKQVIVTE